jgi:hypothetical protein
MARTDTSAFALAPRLGCRGGRKKRALQFKPLPLKGQLEQQVGVVLGQTQKGPTTRSGSALLPCSRFFISAEPHPSLALSAVPRADQQTRLVGRFPFYGKSSSPRRTHCVAAGASLGWRLGSNATEPSEAFLDRVPEVGSFGCTCRVTYRQQDYSFVSEHFTLDGVAHRCTSERQTCVAGNPNEFVISSAGVLAPAGGYRERVRRVSLTSGYVQVLTGK